MSQPSGRLRRFVAVATSRPARVAVTVALLALVASSIDWSAFEDQLASGAWGWFVLAIALTVIALLIGALRWHLLLRGAALPVGLIQSLRAYGIGAFANNLLPTGFGGDAVRAWIVGRSGKPLARSMTSVLVDRVTALGCLIPLSWLGVAVASDPVPGPLLAALALVTAALLGGAAIGALALRSRHLERVLPGSLQPWAGEVGGVIRAYERDRELLLGTLTLGLIFQALIIASVWFAAKSVHIGLDLAEIAIVVPVVLVATVLPISIAGFGVREGTYVALLAEFGISATEATLLSLLTVAAMAIATLPGGLAVMVSGGRAAIEPPASDGVPSR